MARPFALPALRLPVMPRLGFASRLIMLVALLLFVAVALTGGLSFIVRSADPAKRFPLADQIGAIHAVLDGAAAAERPLLLRAINSADLSIQIVGTKPPSVPPEQRLRAVEWLVEQYLEQVGTHHVYATSADVRSNWFGRMFARLSPAGSSELSIAVSLSGGEYMLVGLKGSPAARFFGMPIGFWFGGLGALMAAIIVFAIMREARPIEALAASVAGFARDAEPRPVEAGGAPEIRTLIAASNDMQQSISALLKGRTVLLGAVSHDLRTFLTRLRLRVEAIDDDVMRDKAIGDIEDMTHMIDSAIAVARGASSSGRREPVDMAELVAGDVAERRVTGARITTDLAEPAVVVGDPVALKRVVANCIDNASRHGGGRIHIAVTRAGPDVHLTVDDDGPGVPVSERRAVFEPFYRLDASRNRATGGTGLGLAIVRDIVAAHGGVIAIETSPLGGARFAITLPG